MVRGENHSPGEGNAVAIGLIPFDCSVEEELSFLPEALHEAFGLRASWCPAIPLPRGAYRKGRGQYLAASLLQALARTPPGKYLRLLGIADVDLYAPGLNFVFGQAVVGGRECVISLWRLRPYFYGLSPEWSVFRDRVVKEAVHELGHTFGLGHCRDPGCVMRFSNSIADTDRKGRDFCPHCRGSLERVIGRP
ncbi:archaemetzincin family Zn-dependent metalloprotease [Candidatus Solincola tengchongensis]|uniref:archaemetzincin family Zn-dependent metalloprotease n=1 Tax=Candidatus Solincola tengchongensis TaxID=2900693 RepID=UPI00257E4EFC|nr:archaemetzincin family Zn-dependent metalloprotease [Candidatus Solincola tengchongensis]